MLGNKSLPFSTRFEIVGLAWKNLRKKEASKNKNFYLINEKRNSIEEVY